MDNELEKILGRLILYIVSVTGKNTEIPTMEEYQNLLRWPS